MVSLQVNVGIFDGIAFILYLVTLFLLYWKGKGKFTNQTKFILFLMIFFALFHTLSNTIEWLWDNSFLDPMEDFIEILESVLWAFFLFSYIQSRKEMEILTHQEKILHLAKFESIGNLAGGITHDLRNHLGVIMGSLELLEMDANLQGELKELLSNAKEACFKAKDVSDDLLNLGKEQKLTLTKFNVMELLKKTIPLTLSNTKTQVDFKDPIGDTFIFADHIMLERVFQNLAINASQAMKGAGIIDIEAHILSIHANQIFGLKRGEFIQINITDHGSGIPQEKITAIFDPYFTTKPNGTGLGLAIAFNIIRSHKGTIEVESDVNKGTCFSVILPLDAH